ncbi:MAG: hypothetical protein R3C03_01315 [Pirellulaceae bacterium]
MSDLMSRELSVYLMLADVFQNKLNFPERDRMLVLAGSCASLLGHESLSNFCRHLILQNNRGHMIGRYQNFATALEGSDFQVFLKQVAKRYPLEKAESLVEEYRSGEMLCANDFSSPFDYYCALMKTDSEWIEDNFD